MRKHTIEMVYIGGAGNLTRYKVVDGNKKQVGLFRTRREAENFIYQRGYTNRWNG